MIKLKYYTLFEPNHSLLNNPIFDISKDFPGLSKVVISSIDFDTYIDCVTSALNLLQEKNSVLNNIDKAVGDRYKIYFEKNQFSGTDVGFEQTEVLKMYIADSLDEVYNSVFSARVFFSKSPEDAAFCFDAPSTIQ